MKLEFSGTPSVSLEECKRRAGEYGRAQQEPMPASSFADAIWPGHRMKPQGAGLAASRVLKEMEKSGRAGWVSRLTAGHQWGWTFNPPAIPPGES